MLNGYKNEYSFCEIFHDKFVSQLEPRFHALLEKIYDRKLNDDEYIICWKSFKTDKVDIIIRVGAEKKFLSIKSGKNNSVHLETLHEMKKFFRECGFSEELIDIYNRYHYAEDESGTRICTKDYQEKHVKEIQKFNTFANQEDVLERAIERFLFRGKNSENHIVDVIIHGTPEQFYCLTKQEVFNYLKNHKNVFNSIHFGSLILQPWTRNLSRRVDYEYRRNYVQVKWYRLEDVFREITTCSVA